MVGLQRQSIKNEGCGEEVHSIERRDDKEMENRGDESSNKQYV